MTYTLTLLPGDGIGPEITAVTRRVLEALSQRFEFAIKFNEFAFGGASIDQFGEPLTEDTLNACKAADAVFLGAVGGPKWDNAPKRPEAGLLALRKALGVYANLRPVSVHPKLAGKSPLRPDLVAGTDIMIVRELTGGLYFGKREVGEDFASDTCTYTRAEIERVARIAFKLARSRRKKLTSVDKANVLDTSRLWRKVMCELAESEFPDIAVEHMYIDAAAMHLLRAPSDFDVVVTENMFGDILSDEASMLAGSIGLLGSSSLGDKGPGLFEPIHGSAPDIAGQNKANPLGALESAAQLLEVGLGEREAAKALREAMNDVHEAEQWTADLGGRLTCQEMGEAVYGAIKAQSEMQRVSA